LIVLYILLFDKNQTYESVFNRRISNKEPQNVEVWNRFALTFSGLSGSVEYLPSTFDIPCSILDIRFS